MKKLAILLSLAMASTSALAAATFDNVTISKPNGLPLGTATGQTQRVNPLPQVNLEMTRMAVDWEKNRANYTVAAHTSAFNPGSIADLQIGTVACTPACPGVTGKDYDMAITPAAHIFNSLVSSLGVKSAHNLASDERVGLQLVVTSTYKPNFGVTTYSAPVTVWTR